MSNATSEIRIREFTQGQYDDPEMTGLEQFLKLVRHREPWSIATAMLLNLNGNIKRGKHVNGQINAALRRRRLICTPSIENADYYGTVVISDPRDEVVQTTELVSVPLSSFRSSSEGLIGCGRTVPIAKVLSLMIQYDISQLPVLSSNRKHVYGVVTWRSLAQKLLEGTELAAEDVMEPAGHVAESSNSFLDLVARIVEQGFVLYSVPDEDGGQKIGGIVTASDLAQTFDGATSTFLRLQEIESRIRVLLNRAPLPKLEEHLDTARSSTSRVANFRGATDMMFSEYLNALKDQDVWVATKIRLDQGHLLSALEKVRDVRNDVMHFVTGSDDDEAAQPEDEVVQQALRMLRAVPL